jgi:uncharacterized repeat protein (TIGR02543 family)
MNNARQGAMRLAVVFCAGLLLFAGCKDLFHEKPEEKPREWTIAFDADGGSPSTTRRVRDGNTVGYSNMPSDPTRSGYSFGGWYTSRNGSGSQFTAYTTVNSNMTVYAYWTISGFSGISNITYSSVSGGNWTFEDNVGLSPPITDGSVTKARIRFTGGGDGVSIIIILQVSSEEGCDWAFISTLDNDSAAYDSGYYERISGENSTTVTIPVPTAGSHFIDIGYQKDGSISRGSDGAGFMVVTGSSGGETSMPDNLSLDDALTWISNNAVEGGEYTITLRNNETIAPKTLSYGGKKVGVTLTGGATEWTVSFSSSGALFTVGSGVTLTLGNNVTLQGRNDNDRGNYSSEIVHVESGGELIMKDGAKITGNRASIYGSGVGVYSGTFTMDGGTISDNYVAHAGGGGAGVYLWPSSNSLFIMNGGIITNNTATGSGAGVLSCGEFTMNGGEISGNTASSGGGVSFEGGTFTMNGGEISGNTASFVGGGGVYVSVSSGTFTMSGGTISSNTASTYGGGVYVSSGTFTKQSGGTIYGSNASDTLKNTVTDGGSYGHAVYVYADSGSKIRNTTADSGVTLDSAVSGSAGGWEESMPDNLSLDDTLTWISNNAEEGGEYTITLRNNETIAPKTLSYSGKTVGITLSGGTTERMIILSSNGALFTIESGVTLTLDNNLTLQGRSNNTASLITVNSSGRLVMNTGSKISGNTYSDGGGVYVSTGTFTMNGGTISGNTAYYGGGVYVDTGTFTMSGGTISGNTTASSSYSHGSGVYVDTGTFTMSGGTISGNTGSSSYSRGGGVYVSGGTFTMSGGTISGNTASSGGGVYVSTGTFTMSGGTISGNTTFSYSGGGGVYVNGTFTMSGGTISGNTASSSYSYGGGVSVSIEGTFIKQSGGTIYGSGAGSSLKNTAHSDSYGHAVYVGTSPSKKRNSTAGSGVTLNSGIIGSAGGWE